MEENILVSTIITTYKRNNMLKRAIKSVLEQDYKNIEIIVVDDNDEYTEYRSEVEKIISKFDSDSRILYLKHKKNLNGAFARNTGIKHAKGKLITFLDDDDYFERDRFSSLVPIISNSKSNVGLISSGYRILNNGKLSNVKELDYNKDITFELLKTKLETGSGSNFIIKKEVLSKIGNFDTKFLRHQDYEFLLRVSLKYDFIAYNQPLLVVQADSKHQNKVSIEKLIQVKKLYFDKFSYLLNEKNKDEVEISQYEEIINLMIKNREIIKYQKIIKKFLVNHSLWSLVKLISNMYIKKVKLRFIKKNNI